MEWVWHSCCRFWIFCFFWISPRFFAGFGCMASDFFDFLDFTVVSRLSWRVRTKDWFNVSAGRPGASTKLQDVTRPDLAQLAHNLTRGGSDAQPEKVGASVDVRCSGCADVQVQVRGSQCSGCGVFRTLRTPKAQTTKPRRRTIEKHR